MATSVTATTYPSARNDSAESKLEAWISPTMPDGVIWFAASQLKLFADSAGMQVKLPSGSVLLGGVRGDLSSQTTLDIAAAHSSNPRIDTVIAKLNRADAYTPPGGSPTTAYTITFEVVTGTAASSPVAPTLVSDATYRRIPIGNVRVEAGATTIAANKITLRRKMTGDTGWFTFATGASNYPGSSLSVQSWFTDGARARFNAMTCEFHIIGTIEFDGDNTDPVVRFGLPIRASSFGIPFANVVAGYVRKVVTGFDSDFHATYADVRPLSAGVDTFPTTGFPLAASIGGSYEIFSDPGDPAEIS